MPAFGANVTLINNVTGDKLYAMVNQNGFYLIDLNEMDWEDNDGLTIIINGTERYDGWTGVAYIIADSNAICQKVDDVVLQK